MGSKILLALAGKRRSLTLRYLDVLRRTFILTSSRPGIEKNSAKITYDIRQLRPEELATAKKLWQDTELDEGMFSPDTFYQYYPKGFFGAVSKEDGSLLGMISNIVEPPMSYLGFLAVRPDCRGCGIAAKLLRAALDHGSGHNISLSAVSHMESYYKKFLPNVGSWMNLYYHGPIDIPSNTLTSHFQKDDVIVEEVKEPQFSDVQEYDEKIFKTKRGYLVATLRERTCQTFVARDARKGCIVGFGSIRDNLIRGRRMLGPLYADNRELAEALVDRMIRDTQHGDNKTVMAVALSENPEAVRLAEKFLTVKDKEKRLYGKQPLVLPYAKVFFLHNTNYTNY